MPCSFVSQKDKKFNWFHNVAIVFVYFITKDSFNGPAWRCQDLSPDTVEQQPKKRKWIIYLSHAVS